MCLYPSYSKHSRKYWRWLWTYQRPLLVVTEQLVITPHPLLIGQCFPTLFDPLSKIATWRWVVTLSLLQSRRKENSTFEHTHTHTHTCDDGSDRMAVKALRYDNVSLLFQNLRLAQNALTSADCDITLKLSGSRPTDQNVVHICSSLKERASS